MGNKSKRMDTVENFDISPRRSRCQSNEYKGKRFDLRNISEIEGIISLKQHLISYFSDQQVLASISLSIYAN